MFRAHVLIVRRPKLHYTVSGIIIPIDGRPVHGTAIYRNYFYSFKIIHVYVLCINTDYLQLEASFF